MIYGISCFKKIVDKFIGYIKPSWPYIIKKKKTTHLYTTLIYYEIAHY